MSGHLLHYVNGACLIPFKWSEDTSHCLYQIVILNCGKKGCHYCLACFTPLKTVCESRKNRDYIKYTSSERDTTLNSQLPPADSSRRIALSHAQCFSDQNLIAFYNAEPLQLKFFRAHLFRTISFHSQSAMEMRVTAAWFFLAVLYHQTSTHKFVQVGSRPYMISSLRRLESSLSSFSFTWSLVLGLLNLTSSHSKVSLLGHKLEHCHQKH